MQSAVGTGGHARCMAGLIPPTSASPAVGCYTSQILMQTSVDVVLRTTRGQPMRALTICSRHLFYLGKMCSMHHTRQETLSKQGVDIYLEHVSRPGLLHRAQRLPQLHIDVHGARAGRCGLPVGGVHAAEGHARWYSSAGGRQIKRPARVATKDLHLISLRMRQMSLKTRLRTIVACML